MFIHNQKADPFTCFRLYVALKVHFTTPDYDYVQHRGNIRCTFKQFEKRNDKKIFEALSRKYTPKQLKEIFIAYLATRDVFWIGDIIDKDDCLKVWKGLKSVSRNFSYHFESDIHTIMRLGIRNLKEATVASDGTFPVIFRLYREQKIVFPTLVVVNRLVNFTEIWYDSDDVILENMALKIDKYDKFNTKLDIKKYEQIIQNVLTEYQSSCNVF